MNALSIDPALLLPLALLAGYLIGSIPTAYLVVRQLTGQDIRQIGSGNVGATNVKRAAGGKAALFVLFFDLHKGIVPVVLCKALFPHETWAHVLVALGVVLGHSKSIYLGFSGGKSAASGLGGLIGLSPIPALLTGLIAFGIMKATRIVSVGSLAACVIAPVLMLLFGQPLPYLAYTVLAALYVGWLHKANISRLRTGTENRF